MWYSHLEKSIYGSSMTDPVFKTELFLNNNCWSKTGKHAFAEIN